jgi:hypothetical protein
MSAEIAAGDLSQLKHRSQQKPRLLLAVEPDVR